MLGLLYTLAPIVGEAAAEPKWADQLVAAYDDGEPGSASAGGVVGALPARARRP